MSWTSRWREIFLILLWLFGSPCASRAAGQSEATPPALSPEALYNRIAPSVVTVIVRDDDGKRIATGSGFAIDESQISKRYGNVDFDKQFAESQTKKGSPTQHAYVLTNYHVIRPAVSADITLSSGEEGFVSNVLAEDAETDLALLLVFAPLEQPIKGIPFAAIDPSILATVYAIGSPKGFSGSASEGRVSGYRELARGHRWLQTTAPISPGSSGGPLLSVDGKLVGVTTITIADAQNINFAIPASVARSFLETVAIKPRAVPSGASIKWHEQVALSAASQLKKWASSETEQRAFGLLDQARLELQSTDDGKNKDAASHYEHAIALATEAKSSLRDVSRFIPHYTIGRAQSALWYHESKLQWEADDPVRAAMIRTRDSPHAIAALENFVQVTKLSPDFAPGWWRLSVVYSQREDWSNALSAAERLVKLMPRSADAFALRAECQSKLKHPDSAITDLEMAIELSPRNAAFRHRLAEVFTTTGKNAKAVESYKAALGLEIDEAAARGGAVTVFDDPTATYYKLGVAHRKAGNFDDAVSIFTKIKEMGQLPWSDICDEEIVRCKQQQR